MKNTVQMYYRYLLSRNKRMYMILFIFLFLIMPFMVLVRINAKNEYIEIAQMLAASGCVLSFVSPIYFFRHVFWKRSADVYFVLPIERKTLFKSTFLFSVLSYLIPLYIMYYIAVFLCFIIGNTSGIEMALIMPLMLTIIFVTISCIITWIVSFSNNLLDAIVISGMFFFLPYLFCQNLNTYLFSLFQDIMVGNGTYINEIGSYLLVDQVLVIWQYAKMLTWLLTDRAMYTMSMADSVALWPLIYWAIIGVVAWFGSCHLYTKRKQEQSEQRTTKWYGYPLLAVFLICIMSLDIFTNLDLVGLISPFIIVFSLYNVLLFLAQRKMKLRVRTIIAFFFIFLFCYGFTQTMQATKAFHLVDEELQVDNLKTLQLTIRYEEQQDHLLLVVGYDKQGNAIEKKVSEVQINAQHNEMMEYIVGIQKQLINNGISNNDHEYVCYLSFYFSEKHNSLFGLFRSYHISSMEFMNTYHKFIYELSEKQAKGEIKGVLEYSIEE